MKVVLIVIAGLVALVLAFIVWRIWATYAGGRAAYRRLAARIRPVGERLMAGQDPDPADLERFAADRETRLVLYDALAQFDKAALFPSRYLTFEAMAEADLVAWLYHPNELGAAPDEMELMSRVPAPGEAEGSQEYFVFRYRTLTPHWAAADGWLAGIAGPYATSGPVGPRGPGTFSRFEAFESRTPAEHVRLVHEALSRRR